MKVILVENDRKVVRDISFCLRVPWPDVEVISVDRGLEAIELIDYEEPDLVILDSTLPDFEAPDFIARLRGHSDVPLMVLSDVQADNEKAWCLEAGADDYINKPFSPLDLIAKVKVLLRRVRGLRFDSYEMKTLHVSSNVSINPGTREVRVAGERIKLTPIEYRLLLELARSRGRVISVDVLAQRVWGSDYIDSPDYVKRYIYRLRQKLEAQNGAPLFVSERGIGYRLATPE